MSTRAASRTAWKSLSLFNLYRVVVAGLFIFLLSFELGPALLGRLHPALFLWVSAAYFLFSLAAGLVGHRRWMGYTTQVYIQTGVDIVAFTLLIHSSGGVTSGLGMLLIVAIAGASLLQPGRLAVFFAAAASLALLGDQIYSQLEDVYEQTAYTQTGILGAILFATAVAATSLARRTRESEALAAKRGIDLANLAELSEHIIDRMQSGVIVSNDDGSVRLINEAAWMLLGNPTANPAGWLPGISPALMRLFEDWRQRPQTAPKQFRPEGASGTELRVRFTRLGTQAEPATLISLEDTAEISRQLQAVKLASLGRLTASIAHEIRNPLGAISHAGQLLSEAQGLDKGDTRLVQIILDQSQRMNEIINDILRLSRKEKPNVEFIPLAPWLKRFLDDFCRHQTLKTEQVSLSVEPQDAAILADSGQLHQVIWNLCSNARKYGAETPAHLQLEIHAGLSGDTPNPYIDIIDNGPGIDLQSRNQLFEPFFTTSSTGTGLGLYISRELCENNGAHIEYIPIPTGGSCFRIQFPDPNRAMETR